MKQLFVVKHSNQKLIKQAGISSGFDNKQDAKKARDNAGGIDAGFYVSKGKDHRHV